MVAGRTLFALQEFPQVLESRGQRASPVVVQLLGAGLFALEFLNGYRGFGHPPGPCARGKGGQGTRGGDYEKPH